ncbi:MULTISPECIES: hypothetical protein, partial [Prochlorococcus]
MIYSNFISLIQPVSPSLYSTYAFLELAFQLALHPSGDPKFSTTPEPIDLMGEVFGELFPHSGNALMLWQQGRVFGDSG